MCSASQPSFFAEPARQPERHALLAEERVAAVARADRPDGVPLGEVHDEAALGAEIAERVQAAREIVGAAEMLERDASHARHDAHVEHDVLAVGDLDADLREPRSLRSHQEGDDVHRAALHAALEERRQLGDRRVGRHPVVVRARVVFVFRADEGEVLGARDVVRGAPVQVAAGHLLLVQLDQFARRHALLDQLIAFRLRSVADENPLWRGQRSNFVDPSSNAAMYKSRFVGHGNILSSDGRHAKKV